MKGGRCTARASLLAAVVIVLAILVVLVVDWLEIKDLITRDYEYKDFKDLDWTSEGGQVKLNNYAFHTKGVSWHGMQDPAGIPHGLDKVTLDDVLGFLRANGFNAIRLPFSLELALQSHWPLPATKSVIDSSLHNISFSELLEKIVDRAADHGLLVVLTMHCLSPLNQTSALWYDPDHYPRAALQQGWDNVLQVVGYKWNVMGLDLFNEPKHATWGTGDVETDWALGAAEVATHIMTGFPHFSGLLFVQAVHYPGGPQDRAVGDNLEGVAFDPIDLKDQRWNKKIVYSPHVYGPASHEQEDSTLSGPPHSLPTTFLQQYDLVRSMVGRAVLLGAWGISPSPSVVQDKAATGTWTQAVVDYLVSSCSSGNFYRELNPSSSGGLLQGDWRTPNEALLKLLHQAEPNPSRVEEPSRKMYIFRTAFKYKFTKGNWPSNTCRRQMIKQQDFIDLDTNSYNVTALTMRHASRPPGQAAVTEAGNQRLLQTP